MYNEKRASQTQMYCVKVATDSIQSYDLLVQKLYLQAYTIQTQQTLRTDEQ